MTPKTRVKPKELTVEHDVKAPPLLASDAVVVCEPVRVDVPWGEVTVAVVDPEPPLVVLVPEEPGVERDVLPGVTEDAPDEMELSLLAECPLQVAFPAESRPQVSPEGQQKGRPLHSTRLGSAHPENASQVWPAGQHPVTPLTV